ncbi:MAG: hypothetical protein ACKOAR_11120 [Bacteroidota bacterium]
MTYKNLIIILTVAIFVLLVGSQIKSCIDSDHEGEILRKKTSNKHNQKKYDSTQPEEKFVTMDGTDKDGTIIQSINIWSDYQKRTYAGKVRHGESVKYIRREGNGVMIETHTGNRGWVTYFFIKEFKEF